MEDEMKMKTLRKNRKADQRPDEASGGDPGKKTAPKMRRVAIPQPVRNGKKMK
jgi:hypothetical protein